MGLTLVLEESDFAGYIDDGEMFTATVRNVKLKEKPYKDDDGNPVKKVEFKFQIIDDGPQDGVDIWGETSTRFNTHPACRLLNWSEAILGRRLPPQYQLDTDDLYDQQCRILVGKQEWEKDGETKFRNFVRDVIPTRESMAAMTAAEAAEIPF